MRPEAVELIRAKRDGRRLAPGDIRALIAAYTQGEVPEEQMSALLAYLHTGLR